MKEVEKFFQTTGVDISSPKSMFCFINDHFRYDTMNSWNNLESIANCVKVHKLGLKSDPWVALKYLEAEEYFTVNDMIYEWQHSHPNYVVGFNGRSGGYLVLYNKDNMKSVVPEEIDGYETYQDWKDDLSHYGYRVKDFMQTLRETTKLIQDFDKLCDELRAYVEILGEGKFEIDQMENDVTTFNDLYADDLEKLGYAPLEMDADGKVDITEIKQLTCLLEAFTDIANCHKDQGYYCKIEGNLAYLTEKY